MTRKLVFFIFMIILVFGLKAQSTDNTDLKGVLKGGLRIQKTQKLYWENGFAFDYTSDKLWDQRIHFGVSYVTSRMGSAFGSNAIKQDNILVSSALCYRHKKQLQPFTRFNVGYFKAHYEEAVFDVLPSSSMLLSLDVGLCYEFQIPVTVNLSTGYNLISGNGTAGPGTLFPFFYQMSIYYTLFK